MVDREELESSNEMGIVKELELVSDGLKEQSILSLTCYENDLLASSLIIDTFTSTVLVIFIIVFSVLYNSQIEGRISILIFNLWKDNQELS